MRYLITSSLLSSWQYQFIKYFNMSDEQAKEQFMKTLRREPLQQNFSMKAGLDFEKMACNLADDIDCSSNENFKRWREAAELVSHIIQGGVWQCAVKREITIGDVDFLLYGHLDALKEDKIYDIKLVKTYKPGKYKHFPQHPLYLELVPYARKFTYLVSDGERVYIEDYRREEVKPISHTIVQFMDWLADNNLQKEYFKHWQAKER